jgi:hypothetical protein
VPKAPQEETKVRFDSARQKKEFEDAAANYRPRLSLNQWLLLAGIEKLERDREKKNGR